jgi:acetyl-CoA carboxylase biotin carboxyl carrier protein
VELKQVEELIALMRRSGVMHLSLELPDYTVSITRGAEPVAATPAATLEAASEPAAPPPSPTAPAEAQGPRAVTSPVVGVYQAVGGIRGRTTIVAGQRVKRGQFLGSIEAMKVPNEVKSPCDGVVSSVLVEDGSAVEYGQTLFLIVPEESRETDDSEAAIGLA